MQNNDRVNGVIWIVFQGFIVINHKNWEIFSKGSYKNKGNYFSSKYLIMP